MGEKKRRKQTGGYRIPERPTMSVLRDQSAEEIQRYVTAANETMEAAIAGGYNTNDWVRERFAASDIVFGVYQDPNERYGVGVAILRGIGRIKLASQGTKETDFRVFYLRCTDKVHAEAHCLALGDGRQELGEEYDEASEPVRMRVMTGLGMDKREEFARRANEMEDEAIAVGTDPNVWLRGAFKADVVYGVWQDFNEPGDVGVAMLKGRGAMDRIIATGKKETLGYTWVRCQSIEQAEAMYRELGDGAGARM